MPLSTTVASEAWFWLGGSLLAAMLWTNLAWLFSPWVDAEASRETPASLAESIVSRVGNWRFAPTLFQGLRLLYYIGIPSAALFWGHDAVVSRVLGLKRLALPTPGSAPLDANWAAWAHDLGWAAVLGLGSGGLILLAALVHRQALSKVDNIRQGHKAPAWEIAREAFYHEAHWAFYRNAPVVALGSYWGTWTGLALVALEALVNPTWREGLREPSQAWSQLSRGALLVVSSLIYLQTQNLWLALLLHWAISWTLEVVYAAPAPAPSDSVASAE
jgi:hypothetical protein